MKTNFKIVALNSLNKESFLNENIVFIPGNRKTKYPSPMFLVLNDRGGYELTTEYLEELSKLNGWEGEETPWKSKQKAKSEFVVFVFEGTCPNGNSGQNLSIGEYEFHAIKVGNGYELRNGSIENSFKNIGGKITILPSINDCIEFLYANIQ